MSPGFEPAVPWQSAWQSTSHHQTDSTQAVSLDLAPDLSSTNSSQAHCVDVEHQPMDLAVGGSNPSRHPALACAASLNSYAPNGLNKGWLDAG